jgi:hypothetical protein
VQAEFERGVAMMHSYWFLVARRVFEGVLQQDPGCAIAYWGIAMDLLRNSLGGPPSRENANAAWAAMPWQQPKTLTDDEVYALTAYIPALNKIIGENDVINVETLPAVKMPNRDGFISKYPDKH